MSGIKIYIIENIDNDSNKVYIGKTKNPISRGNDHKRKYGPDIIYSIIDEIYSLDKQIWEPLETYWIEQFRAWGFDVVNKNKGGGGPINHSTETKIKMRKPKSKEFSENISQKLKGKPKPPDFGDKISKALKGNLKRNKNISTSLSKTVLQYDTLGNFIQEWASATEAELHFRPNRIKSQDNIGLNIRNKIKNPNLKRYCYGFSWTFKNHIL
jgi:hypothetical protein